MKTEVAESPKPPRELYEKIASQLYGTKVTYILNEPQKPPKPDKDKRLPPPPTRCVKEGVEIVKPKMPPLEYIKNRGLF